MTDASDPQSPPATPTPDPGSSPGKDVAKDGSSQPAPAEQTARAAKRAPRRKRKKKGDGSKLGSSRGIETMFRTSYRTHLDLSAIADNKANIMISINGIIISVVIASIAPRMTGDPILLLPTVTLLVGCVVSMVFSVAAARPRVTSLDITLDDVMANRSNLLFFGNFVRLSQDDYVTGMSALVQDTDRLYTNMMRDLYGLGRVLDRKYRLLRSAYTLFMVGLLASVAAFVVVYLIGLRSGSPLSP